MSASAKPIGDDVDAGVASAGMKDDHKIKSSVSLKPQKPINSSCDSF